ncbi:MAG TPA: DNA-processing protein DprA [Bacillota bacterium]|nr:DNA-processing protein DprA [Bacillota bacterium]
MKPEEDKLAADMFVSEMQTRRILSGGEIRKMMHNGRIQSHRDFLLRPINEMLPIFDGLRSEKRNEYIALHRDMEKEMENRLRMLSSYRIRSCSQEDPEYPKCLRELPGMPMILYWRGDESLMNESFYRVAIVGTRKPSVYGERVTRYFTENLAAEKLVIVSGLARGIDTIAHRAAIAMHGKTIAVMPCGLDLIYPPENKGLLDTIENEGLIISEMPPGQQALRQYFPARNRIMSGISDAIAIMEAGEKSGTLHTANFAAAQGKDVFVVPGSVFSPMGKGNMQLIKDGASLLSEPEDILARIKDASFFRKLDNINKEWSVDSLKEKISENPEALSLDEIHDVLLHVLFEQEMTMEEIISETCLPYKKVARCLSNMEVNREIEVHQERYVLTFRF